MTSGMNKADTPMPNTLSEDLRNHTMEQVNVHQLVKDLRQHSALYYWADLLLCASIFWTAIAMGTLYVAWWPLVLVVGSLALYRMAMFTHEIAHFGKSVLPGFGFAWNVLCGVPVLMPAFMLKSHVDHHAVQNFGTARDPEYLPFAAHPFLRKTFLRSSFLVAFVLFLRSFAIVPLAWFTPSVRRLLRQRMTFMTMHTSYEAGKFQRLTKHDVAWEITTVVWIWGLVSLVVIGALSWYGVALLFACMTLANVLNAWRTLHAHRYESTGHPTNGLAQVSDSTTFDMYWLIGELLCPVGQRFHAAHHLLPYLPYHALRKAHERLLHTNWQGQEAYANTLRNTFKVDLNLQFSLLKISLKIEKNHLFKKIIKYLIKKT